MSPCSPLMSETEKDLITLIFTPPIFLIESMIKYFTAVYSIMGPLGV